MSVLKVNEIQHTNGTTALTLDTNGNIIESNNELSWWHKTAASETISSTTLLDDWTEISDGNGFKRIGGAFTVSSGIWTFPRTGVYRIEAQFAFSGTDATRYASGFISFSNNSGSSYDNLVFYRDLNDSGSNTVYSHITTTRYVNITNTGTHKVKFQFEAASAVALRGSMSETAVVFQRIAPPQ
tara:strand:- start:93 stop:644 length:552 start_codon:yes stop_codon:yes gene_type:complete